MATPTMTSSWVYNGGDTDESDEEEDYDALLLKVQTATAGDLLLDDQLGQVTYVSKHDDAGFLQVKLPCGDIQRRPERCLRVMDKFDIAMLAMKEEQNKTACVKPEVKESSGVADKKLVPNQVLEPPANLVENADKPDDCQQAVNDSDKVVEVIMIDQEPAVPVVDLVDDEVCCRACVLRAC
eukprot:4553932-Pleurochrysis_carterae.AAC.1